MKQLWTVYEVAQRDGDVGIFTVRANKWTDKGPQATADTQVVGTRSSYASAKAEAARLQADYDQARKIADAAYE